MPPSVKVSKDMGNNDIALSMDKVIKESKPEMPCSCDPSFSIYQCAREFIARELSKRESFHWRNTQYAQECRNASSKLN